MLNMSNQFYDYLSNKLIDYFTENNLLKGDKFFIRFDEDEQVLSFYDTGINAVKSALNFFDLTYNQDVSQRVFKTY